MSNRIKELLSWALIVILCLFGVWFTIYSQKAWVSMPCKEYKNHWLFSRLNAPARCIGDI